MQVSIENTGDLSRKMNVTIPAADIDRMAAERLEHISKTVKLPGFRPGHVPMDVVRQRYGEQVMGEISERIVQETLGKAIVEHEVRPAGQPRLESAGKPEAGKDFSYEVAFDIYPEIEPKGHEGMKLTRETAEPTDKMVDELLERLRTARKNFKLKEGAAETGDRVMIDAEGYLAGASTPFEGGTLKNHHVELGSGQFIPGFEEGLKGAKAGEDREVNVTFPSEYHSSELAGADATFKVRVLRVESASLPEMDDAFAKTFGENSLEDLRAKVRGQIEADLQQASQQRIKRQMFDQLDKDNKFPIPDALVDNEFNAIWNAQLNDLKSRNLTFADLGKGEDELRSDYRELARRRVRLGLLLAEIGKSQDIKVSSDEMKAEVEKVAARYPDQSEQVRQYYADPQRQNELAGPMFEQKVVDWIVEHAKLTDKKVDPEELVQELQ